jgi:hypothetical protein
MELNVIGRPTTLYCNPSPDQLPDPLAHLLTGITPECCQRGELSELQFVEALHPSSFPLRRLFEAVSTLSGRACMLVATTTTPPAGAPVLCFGSPCSTFSTSKTCPGETAFALFIKSRNLNI